MPKYRFPRRLRTGIAASVLDPGFVSVQVESGLATQALKPTVDLIKRRYGEDKERIQKETSALYEKTGVNPLAGAPRHADRMLGLHCASPTLRAQLCTGENLSYWCGAQTSTSCGADTILELYRTRHQSLKVEASCVKLRRPWQQ